LLINGIIHFFVNIFLLTNKKKSH